MAPAVSVLPLTSTEQLVAAALAAPSMYNTQPWWFSVDAGDKLRIHADSDRLLPISDPGGRALYVATGAALFNVCLTARRLGYQPEVQPRPEPGDPAVLAEVHLAGGGAGFTYTDEVLYRAIGRRHTNRFPFRQRRMSANVLGQLQEAADLPGIRLKALDSAEADDALGLVRQANRALESDRLYVAELAYWTSRTENRPDGVPVSTFGRRPEAGSLPLRDFALGLPGAPVWVAAFEPEPQLFVLATEGDEPDDWLRAGEALQRVLLVATTCQLSASFFYQPFQIAELRARMRRAVRLAGYPQLLFRLGYGREVRGPARRSPSDALRSGAQG